MIKYESTDSERTFYVIFDKQRGAPMFWNLFTRKSFDHVYLLTELKDKSLLALTPTPNECLIAQWGDGSLDIKFFMDYMINAGNATAILKFNAKYNADVDYTPRGIISCVTFTKYILGVGGFSLTPYGLYKQLLKLGAVEYGK